MLGGTTGTTTGVWYSHPAAHTLESRNRAMISSLEDAVPFFMYWKSEQTPLHAMLSYDGMSFLSTGRICECSEESFEYSDPEGGFNLRIDFGAISRVAFMTPDDFHGGSVRKGTEDVPLKHGWILHTGSGGFMNFFEEDDTAPRGACHPDH